MERGGEGYTWEAVSTYCVLMHSIPKADSVNSAENGGLNSIAKIDTTVTVVDAFRFFEEFETIELLHQRFASEVETPEDERTVTDLMIDQIEFADVIIVNKVSISFLASPCCKLLKPCCHDRRISTIAHLGWLTIFTDRHG